MIILEDEKLTLINFIVDSIEAFKTQKGNFNSIGIYCCPWSGWISISFNVDKSIEDASYNCPDFDFVEFDLLEPNKWRQEYESEAPTYKFGTKTVVFNWDLGDEVINEIVFEFLSTIIITLKNTIKVDILLQMLDSKFYKVF